ncbi:MAG: pentapeptide repeat-containing protein [Waltera sp.]
MGADFRECTFEQTSFAGAELTAAVFPQKVFRFWKSVQSSFR